MTGKQKVESPQGNAAGRDIHFQEASRVGNVIHINGTGNVVAGRDVILNVAPNRKRQAAVEQYDPVIHISQAQQLALQALRDEWVALHNKLKRAKLDYGAALKRMNNAAGATACALVQQDRFEDAVVYAKRQMTILRSMKSAPKKDDRWRVQRISAIKVRCIKQLGDQYAYRAYIKKNFGADSLTDLATDELQRTYAYIMAKKVPA